MLLSHPFPEFQPTKTILSAQVNANFQATRNWANGNIQTDNFGTMSSTMTWSVSSNVLALDLATSSTEGLFKSVLTGVLAASKSGFSVHSAAAQTTGKALAAFSLTSDSASIPVIQTESNGTSPHLLCKADDEDVFRVASDGQPQIKSGGVWAFLGVPAGVILPFGGTTAPDGYLLCDGSTVSRTTYAELFAAIGTNFGEGDGSTTFHLPDGRGRFLRGVDDGAGRDPNAASRTAMNTGGNTGDAVGSVQDDATAPNGLATASDGDHNHEPSNTSLNFLAGSTVVTVGAGAAGGGITSANSLQTTSTNGAHTHSLTGDDETRPINAYVNFIIRF